MYTSYIVFLSSWDTLQFQTELVSFLLISHFSLSGSCVPLWFHQFWSNICWHFFLWVLAIQHSCPPWWRVSMWILLGNRIWRASTSLLVLWTGGCIRCLPDWVHDVIFSKRVVVAIVLNVVLMECNDVHVCHVLQWTVVCFHMWLAHIFFRALWPHLWWRLISCHHWLFFQMLMRDVGNLLNVSACLAFNDNNGKG